jgi:hypothetical protein
MNGTPGMLIFCLAIYLAFTIPTLVILWAALNVAQESDERGIHPF